MVQENSYYAFGLPHNASVVPTDINRELLGNGGKWDGKWCYELSNNTGPDLYMLPYRQYDPVLGHFNNIDPMAEKYHNFSPYNYCFNNPINFSDPSGADPYYDPYGYWDELDRFMKDMWAWVDYNNYNNYYSGSNTAFWNGIMNYSSSSQYGGMWSQTSGFTSFQSDYDAFRWGADYMQSNNLWGMNGFVGSFEQSKKDYYALGGTDANIKDMPLPEMMTLAIITGYRTGGSWVTTNGRDVMRQLMMNGGYWDGTMQKGNDWLDKTQMGLGAFDLANGAKEELINYAIKSSPIIGEMKYVKAVKVVSKGLFAAQAGISLYQAGNAFYTNDSNKWGVAGKAGLDITMGYISLVGGPIGWGIGAVYFIGDAAGWWGNWGEAAPTIPYDIKK